MYGTGVVTGPDSAAIELRRLLEVQARELSVVLARLTDARALLPRQSDTGWRGFAHFFYGIKLDELASELARLHEQLSSALRQTQRAADTLGSRVG
ncbi:MAG: hypothetical protein ABI053_01635 [Lacisediminihabitans sp.]